MFERKAPMIKCETHLHTKGASYCGLSSPEEIAAEYYLNDYGAVVVTNHYMQYLFDTLYTERTLKQKVARYISYYKRLKECCAPHIKVFLGLELNLNCMNTPEVMPAAEFLCYGVTEEFLYRNMELYNLTQRQLFELCEENGIVMFQSHPFRSYCVLGDPKYMHGVEVYNGHPTQQTNNEKSERFAGEHNLREISGSDYHSAGGAGGGIYIPENIDTERQLAGYIKNNKLKLIKGLNDGS
jgi:predicted metal-dependent phosphoesterase TrpH